MAGDNGIVKESVHVPEEAPKEAHPYMVEHEEVEKYREEWEMYKYAHNGFEHYLIYELKRSQAKYKKLEEAFDTKTRVHDKLNADYVKLTETVNRLRGLDEEICLIQAKLKEMRDADITEQGE